MKERIRMQKRDKVDVNKFQIQASHESYDTNTKVPTVSTDHDNPINIPDNIRNNDETETIATVEPNDDANEKPAMDHQANEEQEPEDIT